MQSAPGRNRTYDLRFRNAVEWVSASLLESHLTCSASVISSSGLVEPHAVARSRWTIGWTTFGLRRRSNQGCDDEPADAVTVGMRNRVRAPRRQAARYRSTRVRCRTWTSALRHSRTQADASLRGRLPFARRNQCRSSLCRSEWRLHTSFVLATRRTGRGDCVRVAGRYRPTRSRADRSRAQRSMWDAPCRAQPGQQERSASVIFARPVRHWSSPAARRER